jgi:hypothetical protein
MAAQMITLDDFEGFKEDLLVAIEKLIDRKVGNVSRWLKSDEVQRLLKISPGTLQTLRLNGTIPYTKIGGTIFYDMEDINRILAQSKQNA